MACTPWLFVQRARMYLTSDDLAHYLGIVKAHPESREEIRAKIIAEIAANERLSQMITISRDEYRLMCEKEAALRQPPPVVVEQPTPVDVGWNSLAEELFQAKVEVVG